MTSLLDHTSNTRTIIKDSYRYLRSDVPQDLSERDTKFLSEHHITTVIDLRTAEEIADRPSVLQKLPEFKYINLPVSGGNVIPPSVNAVSESYLNMADKKMQQIVETIEASADNVLFFCNAGKDRTGVVAALLLKRMGFSDEYIIEDYMLSAENLKSALQSYAEANGVDIEIITPQKRYMEEFLKKVSGQFTNTDIAFEKIHKNSF